MIYGNQEKIKMEFNLRPRQVECVNTVLSLLKEGKKSILIVGPPGVGKGSLISYFTHRAVSKGNKVFSFVHKRDLVFNLSKRLKKQFNIDCGIILPKFKPEKHKPVQIASVQTATRRDLEWLQPDVIIGDESHRMLTPTQLKLYDEFVCAQKGRGIPALWFTATPFRPKSDKKKFSDYCDAYVQFTTYRQEVVDRYLVPTDVVCPTGAASMDGVTIRMKFGEKEFDEKEMSDRFSQERVVKALYAKWKEFTGGRMQTCCFNVDKSHNRAVYDYFVSKGVSCALIDEDVPDHERDRIVEKFQEGPFCENPIMFLANIAILSEGVDNQWIKCVIQNYSTLSLTKHVQTTARGSRPCWNSDYTDWLKVDGKYYKEKLLVLDLGGNTVRHGYIDDYDSFGLDISGERKEGQAPTRECPECHRVVYASYRECPHCGFVFPVVAKKNEKLYLDEVEMKRLDSAKSIRLMVSRMSVKQLNAAEPHWLRIIAHCKGHGNVWIAHMMKHKKMIPWFNNDQESWKKLWVMLEETERKHGTYDMYQSLKGGRVLG